MNEGETVTLTVAVDGTAPFTYQWQKEGVNLSDTPRLSGTTSASLVIGSALPADAGNYTVVVSNLADSVVSSAATLTVKPLPPIDGFSVWRSTVFTAQDLDAPAVSGPLADPDGDGLVNLLEYALGHDPKSVEHFPLNVERTATEWIVHYTRPAARADLVYAIESSTTLQDWSAADIAHERIASSGDTEIWEARLATSATTPIFFRLTVTR